MSISASFSTPMPDRITIDVIDRVRATVAQVAQRATHDGCRGY